MYPWESQANSGGTGYEQLQKIIQLAKIFEVVYKYIPVVQIFLSIKHCLGGGVWEGGREVRGP